MRLTILFSLFLLLLPASFAVTPSNLEVYELSNVGFVIGWSTDEPATSQLLYGDTGRLGSSSSQDSTLKTDHQIQINNLEINKVYFFRATGTNSAGERYYSVIGVTRTANYGTDDVITPDPGDAIDASFGVDYFYETKGRDEVRRIENGESITITNFDDLAIRSFGEKLETVLYYVNGQYVQTQNDFPVTLDKQYFSTPGQYTIEAVPYDQDSPSGENNAQGNRGISKTLQITVFAGTNPPDPQPDPNPTPDDTPSSGVPTIELTQLKAFPTAHGYGKDSTGGRGGRVIKVTNLNDGGIGSFRSAMEASGARTIVFDIGGTIRLNRHITIRNPDITIAGQTAPGQGITITKSGTQGGLQFTGASDVIMRDLRVRRGGGEGVSNIRMIPWHGEVKDIIFDRVSVSWPPNGNGNDGSAEMNFGLSLDSSSGRLPHEITIQRSILGESTRGILLFKGPYHLSIYQNYLYSNNERNPALTSSPNNYGSPKDKVHFELVNNIIHNVRGRVSSSVGARASLVSNIWTLSSQQGDLYSNTFVQGQTYNIDADKEKPFTHFYFEDNTIPSGIPLTNSRISDGGLFNSPKEPLGITSQNRLPSTKLDQILPYVGTTNRDTIDTKYIQYYKDGNGRSGVDTGTVPNYPTESRPSNYDSDNDGMPNSFEDEHGLDKNNANDRNSKKTTWNFGTYQVKNTAGYTNLEIYLAWKIGDFDMMIDGFEKPDGSFRITQSSTSSSPPTTVTPPSPPTLSVDTSFGVDEFYVNVGTSNNRVAGLGNGGTINVADNEYVTIQSFGNKLQTVLFFVNGEYKQTQNDWPVVLDQEHYSSPGQYTIEAVPYDQDSPNGENNARGNLGVAKTVTITVVNDNNNNNDQNSGSNVDFSGNKPVVTLNTLKGFPDLWGEGADDITGGRDGIKFFITSLSNSAVATYHAASNGRDEYYTGTLQGALQLNRARHIIPRVAGRVQLSNQLNMNSDDSSFSFHGHLGPRGGIIVSGDRLSPYRVDNVIMRGYKHRLGTNAQLGTDDTIEWVNSQDIAIDHSSFAWAADETLTFWNNDQTMHDGIIVQHNIIAEGRNGGNTGSIIGYTDGSSAGGRETRVSWHNNAYIGNTHRTPNFAGGTASQARIYNNVAYEYQWRLSTLVHDPTVDLAYNYYKEGPSIRPARGRVNKVTGQPSIYSAYNWMSRFEESPDSNDQELWTYFSDNSNSPAQLPNSMFRSSPLSIDPVVGYQPVSAQEAYDEVITNRQVGAHRQVDQNGNIIAEHDAVDEHYLDAVEFTRSSRLLENNWQHPTTFGSSAFTDTNWNGIHDGFEAEHGITDAEQVIRNWEFDDVIVVNNAGYDAFEMWSAYVAGDFKRLAAD